MISKRVLLEYKQTVLYYDRQRYSDRLSFTANTSINLFNYV